MWDSLESIYESAEKDSDCEAYIMPIPYYDKEDNERLTKLRDESNLYSASLDIVSCKEHTVDEIDPDIIFIHNPYDDGNLITSINSDYYTRKIIRDDRLVIYVPYFVSYAADPDVYVSFGISGVYVDYVIA